VRWLFRTEFNVIELSASASQGWYNRGELSKAASDGWAVVNCSATGHQTLLVLIRRRRWFWQDAPSLAKVEPMAMFSLQTGRDVRGKS
jgi:hypothetical protein